MIIDFIRTHADRWEPDGLRWGIPIRLPGTVGAAMAGGGLLPPGDFRQTQTTFADHLAGLRD